MVMNDALKILVDNATTLAERKEIFSLTEAEANGVTDTLVTKLFNSAISKSHVDFDLIPDSKGDITKYPGYKSMVESLDLLRKISINAGKKISEIDIVDKALGNIVANRDVFERGFKLGKDFIILLYNSLVSSCVVSVSSLISSYVDYVRRVDQVEFELVNRKYNGSGRCIDILDKFNKSVSKGEFSKVMNAALKSDTEKFSGASVVMLTAAIVAGTVGLVTLIREAVFFFYYSRMKLSDYLKLQAMFLELNKNNIKANSSGVPASKKNEIIKNQQKVIDKLTKMADKIAVNDTMTVKTMDSEMKKESNYRIADVKSDTAQTNNSGYQLI